VTSAPRDGGVPRDALLDEEAGEVDHAIAFEEKRRVLVADDLAHADEGARIEDEERAITLLSAPTGALDRALGP
jgi:hypothetical protein